MNRQFAGIVTVILAIVAVGLYIHTQNTNVRGTLVFSVSAAALITFFSFASSSRGSSADTPTNEGAFRRAVAASIVVEYILLVGTFAFWKDDPNDPSSKLAETTKLLLTHFTTIVGVVIAFYFGASAYVEAKSRTQRDGSQAGGSASVAQSSAAGDTPPAARP